MRHAVAIAAVLFTAAALPTQAQQGRSLTLVLDVERALETTTDLEMQKELARLLEPAGLRIAFRMRSSLLPGESFSDLLVVTLKGSCDVIEDPMLIDERGPAPLAWAHRAGNAVLPFAVVACDAVKRAVFAATWGVQRSHRAQLVGRAIARVAAHELYHVLENTSEHSTSGVFRASLSGAQLIAKRLDFSARDLERLRQSGTRHETD